MRLVSRAVLGLAAATFIMSGLASGQALGKSAIGKSAKVDQTVKIDKLTLKSARLAFEKQDYRRSINLYSKIPSTSDYWPEALEEKAWAYVHVKEHDEALALVKTLTSPPVKYEIGAEPYLLSGIIQLRLCNYKQLFQTMNQFKKDIKPRYRALEELAKNGKSAAAERFLSRSYEAQEVSRSTVGEDVKDLPRLVFRDKRLVQAFKRSMSVSGLQSSGNQDGETDRQARIVDSRLRALARRDMKDIEQVLRKFHLMEVEATSRMYSKVNLADRVTPAKPIQRDSETLVFPDDSGEVWLDELDNYRVDAKGCPGSSPGNSLSLDQSGKGRET